MIPLDPITKYRRGEYNCAQATVAKILVDFHDLDKQALIQSFSLLGNGVVNAGTCGILLGSLAAMAKILSDSGLEDEQLHRAYEEVTSRFIGRFDSSDCHNILGIESNEKIDFTSNDIIKQCGSRMEKIVKEVEELIYFRTNPAIPIMRKFNSI